ncbi:nuclear transport factor 2 family protein [Aureibaculum sp. 2210JD6-5]|uniref:nuclear transport factor 2 family protein n=1 Tax=Aureibaculum sp. 2210JD6-5 TaxID=3103957 RepID=UPI002AAD3D65|nr:nuclear transport factor 2 family protein [Aureibaculum sp. 2210JD6-5]MDY7396387.1 nuclear transport factor 2 family protein [Aureibaculum sp. 2210JD6-5]
MTKIKVQTDCGNSPKMEFLKDFNTAFGTGNTKFLIDNVTDDIVWNMIGDKTIKGKENYAKTINGMKDKDVSEFIIDNVLTHGTLGAANGVVKMKNGKNYAFSDIYEFKSASSKILKTITSYVIEI